MFTKYARFCFNERFRGSIQDFDEKNKWKPWQKLYYTISNDYLYADPFNLSLFRIIDTAEFLKIKYV